MQFWKDMAKEKGIWVDRGIDCRLDSFAICKPCDDALQANDPDGQRWHDSKELCPKCLVDFEAHALAIDLFGLPRPFNGMLEDRVLTNDEAAADPAPPVPGAFEYFVTRREDPSASDSCDPSKSGDEDLFAPGSGDPFPPDPNEGFLPRPYDGIWPDPSDYLLPGMRGYLLPGMGDFLLPE